MSFQCGRCYETIESLDLPEGWSKVTLDYFFIVLCDKCGNDDPPKGYEPPNVYVPGYGWMTI